MVSAWRNFKNIFPRPLFIIIFRPEMLKFHPYSILTGDTRVDFVIYCVKEFLFSSLMFLVQMLQCTTAEFCICFFVKKISKIEGIFFSTSRNNVKMSEKGIQRMMGEIYKIKLHKPTLQQLKKYFVISNLGMAKTFSVLS